MIVEHLKAVAADWIERMDSPKINFPIAAAALSSPWWLETLTTVSTTAALLLPIIGAAVGLVQLYRLIRK